MGVGPGGVGPGVGVDDDGITLLIRLEPIDLREPKALEKNPGFGVGVGAAPPGRDVGNGVTSGMFWLGTLRGHTLQQPKLAERRPTMRLRTRDMGGGGTYGAKVGLPLLPVSALETESNKPR